MKVTVVGSRGMAGHMIADYLQRNGHTVTTVDRSHLDIEQHNVDQFFDQLDADFLINAVGLLVKDCLDRPDRAATVNAWWPQYCAYKLKDTATRVVHLSTDCVFDGARGNYVEQDIHTETNAYGRSKSFGEVNNNKDVTFRMSIIGPELKNGTGLLNWVLTNKESELPGWDNAWWNGITTLQLAKCIEQHVTDTKLTGVYHLVNNRIRITKYNLLLLIDRTYNLGKNIASTAGPKPVNKVLVDTRGEVDWAIQDYPTQLEELRNFDPLSHVGPATT
jgi:dTDP-4-dehydrorhamnose reductase